MAEKLDPFDVAALERSLNDSATRVSTIWVSFLIFSLYLLTAATTVTHRQLFLAEPVKLPVLNIDLPLWGFFFLAPILFVILHAYVLMQVLLLARTAAAYNDAVEKAVKRDDLTPEENATLRQRLANTLFAQIFAGSPREREGWLGWLLKAMAWITLAIAPILILLVFQFKFLPYHSHLATWTHRSLIIAELTAAFVFWPLVLDAQRDFDLWGVLAQIRRAIALPRSLFGPTEKRRHEWLWFRERTLLATAYLLFVVISLSFATFPGEPHVNLFAGRSISSVECERWFNQGYEHGDLQLDRLILPRIDVVDDDKLDKIVTAASKRRLLPWQSERTRDFRFRDLNCSDLSDADLRAVDLTGARISGAVLNGAALQGALLDRAQLRGTYLQNSQLQGASLEHAELQGALSKNLQLQAAYLGNANMQGASLALAQMQGAALHSAQLQGAELDHADLQGASLDYANVRGASLVHTDLQGTSFYEADLQGAWLWDANLGGASLTNTHLQGASLLDANLNNTLLLGVSTWRAEGACEKAYVVNHVKFAGRALAKEADIARFIEQSVAEIPNSL